MNEDKNRIDLTKLQKDIRRKFYRSSDLPIYNINQFPSQPKEYAEWLEKILVRAEIFRPWLNADISDEEIIKRFTGAKQ